MGGCCEGGGEGAIISYGNTSTLPLLGQSSVETRLTSQSRQWPTRRLTPYPIDGLKDGSSGPGRSEQVLQVGGGLAQGEGSDQHRKEHLERWVQNTETLTHHSPGFLSRFTHDHMRLFTGFIVRTQLYEYSFHRTTAQ